jgi:hypothetical protein
MRRLVAKSPPAPVFGTPGVLEVEPVVPLLPVVPEPVELLDELRVLPFVVPLLPVVPVPVVELYMPVWSVPVVDEEVWANATELVARSETIVTAVANFLRFICD